MNAPSMRPGGWSLAPEAGLMMARFPLSVRGVELVSRSSFQESDDDTAMYHHG